VPSMDKVLVAEHIHLVADCSGGLVCIWTRWYVLFNLSVICIWIVDQWMCVWIDWKSKLVCETPHQTEWTEPARACSFEMVSEGIET
jgi:hypothetical protein